MRMPVAVQKTCMVQGHSTLRAIGFAHLVTDRGVEKATSGVRVGADCYIRQGRRRRQ